jgi:hypothetical protein
MEFDRSRGYFYGVLLGDGHICTTPKRLSEAQRTKGRHGPFLMLKCCDIEMIEAWRDAIEDMVGFRYAISRHNPGQGTGARRVQWKIRPSNPTLVMEAETETQHKTIIPPKILNAKAETKIAFVQGLMDSEGWINCLLSGGIGQCDMTLGFGCADPWFEDFYRLVQSLGVLTSKIYKRPPAIKKNGEPGKPLCLFKIDIQSYLNAGLSFTIQRKKDRLAFCSHILNDYTRDYPRYEDYYRAEDIVWPAGKLAD